MPITGTLQVTTPTDRELVMTRAFAAPRRQVWEAMTRPERLLSWLSGPPGWSMTACENDLKVGAVFRWGWRSPDGREMVMRGVNREVVPLERIVRTESFAFDCEAKAGEQLATLVLTDHDGGGGGCRRSDRAEKTAFSLTLLYPSKQVRDAILGSGMAQRMAAAYARLDALFAALAAGGSITDAA
jgi:uncharacterized protein YndB with AHSA1/START domain